MSVREFEAGDGPAARRLWDDLGGWYRNTSPTSDIDVDRAVARLRRHAAGSLRPRRSTPTEGAWVAVSNEAPVGWLYARADAEQSYVIPLIPPGDTTGLFDALLSPAKEWFLRRGAHQFFVDVPAERRDLRTAAERDGRVLWHRAVLDRDVRALAPEATLPTTVRDFRRSDLAAVQSLFTRRHPEATPPPIPVAFLELRAGWFRDPAWELQRGIWVAGPRQDVLGVAGGNHRPRSPIGFLGPWVLSERASPPVVRELLDVVLEWLRGVGGQRVRTTVPTPPNDDAQALQAAGFSILAESDLYELRT
ncbi:MAG: hypothetical protein L3K14_06160 [Thermoplasmata archaeon]|nr:hypothetical protein [Thermoplasmata archaeon]